MNPRVSVIMPVYNSEKYICQAIQSVLDQSFSNFELIIINDRSTDRSLEIIKSFVDRRIVLINNDKKGTIVESRNQGVRLSRGEFIAFLDSDDITHPDRLKAEVVFLEKNPDAGIVGASVRIIDKDGKETGVKWRENISSEKIPIRLLFGNCFSQSSVMLRKKAIPDEGYRPGFAEDYDLWVRMLRTWKGFHLPKLLLKYRIHVENTSTRKRALQQESVNQIIQTQLENLGINTEPEDLIIHRANYGFAGTDEETKKFIEKRELWLLKLAEANQKSGRYTTKLFNEVLAERFLTTLQTNARLGLYAWKKFWKSPLSKNLNLKEDFVKLLKFTVKCLLQRN